MRKTILTIAALGTLMFGKAQEGQYKLLLSSGLVEPVANFEQVKSITPDKNEVFNGNYFRYIQFNTLPTDEQRLQLENKGIKLLMYLPTNTYMAAIKENTSLQTLAGYNIRGIYTIKAEYKLLKELSVAIKENNYPGYAVKGNKIGIGITAYQNISFDDFKQQLISHGYEITFENEPTNWLVTWVNKNELLNFINQPFICSAELVDDEPTKENNVGRTSHRSNAISTSYSGGRKYNGNGVSVMLQDDGIIGPHIDYQGRIGAHFMTSNSGNHGDHCAGILMGAGNKDPLARGMAWGSTIYNYLVSSSYQGFDSISSHYGKYGIRIISTSYGDGCNAGYTTRAQQLDIQNLTMPQLIHVFSCGNSGTSNCGYGAGAGWGNVTGGHKHSKNSIAVANLDYLDVRNSSSSRGPAHDGRLKPEVSAVGTNVYSTIDPHNYATFSGTSMACPGIAGVFAQLYEAYRALNSSITPPSALIKAIVMNTADDIGNAGPDFSHGYGRVNALNAVKAIENVAYTSGTVSTGATNIHNITVPAGVRQMKVLTYWHDYQAAVSASVALVNNLNTFITTPSSATVNPLVLNFTPNATTLNLPATPGVDNRNNHEQVVINSPAAGNYALSVNGASVPMGPQGYYVTWIFYMDGYTLTYPMGGEGFVPGQTETIRWDAFETTGNQTLEYSTNGGSTWTTISTTIPGAQRYFNWTVPNVLSGQCRVRISRGAYNDASDANFSIIPLPSNLQISWACTDSLRLTWTAAAGATSYDIFKLGTTYMDSIGTSSTTSYVVPSAFSTQTYWFSVRARGPLGAVGRRMIAIQKTPGTFSCPIVPSAPVANYNHPVSICSGASITFTDVSTNAPTSWSWNMPGASVPTSTLQSPTVTYAMAGVYSATLSATNAIGTSTVVKSFTVSASPTVTTAGTNTLCSGTSGTITASGATTYTWQPGNLTGSSVVVTPAANTTYTVTGVNGTCAGNNTKVVTVTPTPTVVVNTASICTGQTATLTASGATTYSWNTGATTSVINPSPASTTVYTVTGTTSGCSQTRTTSITVNTTPTVAVNTATTCAGTSVNLTASGATTYSWNTGATTSSISVTPATTTNYTVTGANGTCVNTRTTTVIVNALPSVSLAASSSTACTASTGGINVTLTGSPAGGTFSGSGVSGSTFTVQPTAGTYTATYSYTNSTTGCSNTAATSIIVSVCTGVGEVSLLDGNINLFPNPNDGIFTLQVNIEKTFDVTIYNNIGQLVYNKSALKGANEINLSEFGRGIYNVVIKADSDYKTIKVIIE